jgi:hypothetical protein
MIPQSQRPKGPTEKIHDNSLIEAANRECAAKLFREK